MIDKSSGARAGGGSVCGRARTRCSTERELIMMDFYHLCVCVERGRASACDNMATLHTRRDSDYAAAAA